MSANFAVLPQAKLAEPEAAGAALRGGQVVVVKGDDNRVIGILNGRSPLETKEAPPAPETRASIVVDPQTPLRRVLRKLDEAGARIAVVAEKADNGGQEILGVITEREVARLSYDAARLSE